MQKLSLGCGEVGAKPWGSAQANALAAQGALCDNHMVVLK